MNVIGKRTIKTGVAVTLTMLLLKLFKLEPAVFGAVSAVANLQPSVYLSIQNAVQQIKVQLLGIFIGLVIGYFFGNNPLVLGIATVVVIFAYNRFKLQSGIVMGLVAALFIVTSPPEQFLTHALSRTGVIIIGLIISMSVNMVLWPPHYKREIVATLRSCDIAVIKYFNHAVTDFVNLDKIELHSHEEIIRETHCLLDEARKLIGYIGVDTDFKYHNQKLLDYVEGIAERADRIYEIIPMRIKRRQENGNFPVSQEFRVILDLLSEGCLTIERVNEKVCKVLLNNSESVEIEEINEEYWDKLTQAIEQWQHKLDRSYYVHALIDVSAVANEIRWTAREGKKILKSLSETLRSE